MYFVIEPEVSGGLGSKTILDSTVHPPIVTKLNYQFDDWLGDDILESFPCYIVTENLAKEIERSSLSGLAFDSVELSKSIEYQELCSKIELPPFRWLKITGKVGVDDFGLDKNHRLVISQKALDIFKKGKLEQSDISQWNE
jgi:hypothetical protein